MQKQWKGNHLAAEDFYYFIDRGLEARTWGPVERHLTECVEFLEILALIVRLAAPPTPEEEDPLRNQLREVPRKKFWSG